MHPSSEPSSVISRGSQEFLLQAHRNNWQRYLAQLRVPSERGADGRAPRGRARAPWDLCILTASDARQAEMVTRQLEMRRAAGILPAATRFLVIPDPAGLRIGSGGATLRLLAALHNTVPLTDPALDPLLEFDPAAQRILIIHSGGDSRRLPHASATGKLFTRIPRVLPDGRASTIFDEFLINLSGVAESVPPGVLLVSGDVLLVFDHLQLKLNRHGVTGVSVAVDAALGTRHGVYVNAPVSPDVQTFLHKASPDVLTAAGAVDDAGQVQIDTGLVWFEEATAHRFATLAQHAAIADLCGLTPHTDAIRANTPINLYGDLLLPMARDTQAAHYLHDSSDGPATPGLVAARHLLWDQLHPLQFSVERLQPAVFVHFGTSDEYWRMLADDPTLAATCGWSRQAGAWLTPLPPATQAGIVAMNAGLGPLPPDPAATTPALSAAHPAPDYPLVVVDSHLAQGVRCSGPAVIAGVHTQHALTLPAGCVLHQLPVQQGSQTGFVTRLLGLRDDPKHPLDHPKGTYLHQPWADWLAALGEPAATLWPHVPPASQNLWTARLFPLVADREESLRLTLPLADPARAPQAWRERWRQAPRLSLAESFAQANSSRLLDEMAALEDQIAAAHLFAAIQDATPAAALLPRVLAWEAGRREARVHLVAGWLSSAPPLLQIRGHKALDVLTRDPRHEDKAFAVLAHMIEADTRRRIAALPTGAPATATTLAAVRVAAAARIDFGGGWTDTPPYSIEQGGQVLNAAVTLRQQHPIIAEAAWLDQPRLVLDSRDIDEAVEPTYAGEIQRYANPADPFALLKAALVMTGIVPAHLAPHTPLTQVLAGLGRGLRLTTQTTIPRGSGLGTSSIMAGAVLAALTHLLGRPLDEANLFDQVLSLEQMLTTGGGWQDQVGGLVGGIHLVTSRPGLPQRLTVAPVALPPQTAAALRDRLCLVYTGQQRLAKNLLRAVVGRWMARDPEMTVSMHAIGQLAAEMQQALLQNQLDHFGELLSVHWTYNQRMDPGCSNPFIDALFSYMQPYMVGAKLAGAGGGGFAIVLTRDADATAALGQALRTDYANTGVALLPSAIADQGLRVQSTPG